MAAANDRTPPQPLQADLDWAIATEFAYLPPGDWLPLLVEFDATAAPKGPPAARWRWWMTDWARAFDRAVQIPELYATLPEERLTAAPRDICTLYLARAAAERVVGSPAWRDHVLRAELGPPLAALPALGPWPAGTPGPAAGARPQRVVMGVIDQGIAFAHPRFQHAQGTRIEAVWQQTVGFIPAGAIDAALVKQLPEDTIYRTLGGIDYTRGGYKPLAVRRAHGTQVLDLLAGARRADDVRTRPIVAVDMPEHAVGDPALSQLTPYAKIALLYILAKAEQLRQPGELLPVVVNLSYGPQDGPHDGTAALERAMDDLVAMFASSPTPLVIVLAAGNGRQARMHASLCLAPGAADTLHWRLQPASRSPSRLELWFEAGAQPEVTLTAPDGQVLTVHAQQPFARLPAAGPAAVMARFAVVNGRACVLLSTAPTEQDPAAAPHRTVPAGLWRVTLRNAGTKAFTVDGWIRRGDTQSGRRAKGRQSTFDEKDYVRHMPNGAPQLYDDPPLRVQRTGTLSGIATGARTVVIGGYVDATAQPARGSAQGPHANAARTRPAPDWLERSDDSPACRGVLAAGNRAGSVAPLSGTSAAAPQAARRIADALTAGLKAPPPAEYRAAPAHRLWPVPAGQVVALTGKGLRAVGIPRWPPRRLP